VIREGYKVGLNSTLILRNSFGRLQVDYARVAITDEQAPLPETLAQILHRVQEALKHDGDLIFNCQMGR